MPLSGGFTDNSIPALSAVLRNASCPLKTLDLSDIHLHLDSFLDLLRSSTKSNLESISLDTWCPEEWDESVWKNFAEILPDLTIKKLSVVFRGDSPAIDSICDGMKLNLSLENIQISSFGLDNLYPELEYKMELYCKRNVTLKKLVSAFKTGTLPVKMLPQVLEALSERFGEQEVYIQWLCYPLLLSLWASSHHERA